MNYYVKPWLSVGKYGDIDAMLYNLSVSDIQVSNSATDSDEETNTDVAGKTF